MQRIIFLSVSLLMTLACFSQRPMSWDEFVDYLYDHGGLPYGDGMEGDAGGEGAGWEDCLEELHRLHEHPLNINTATRRDLQELPFLSGQQILHLIQYVDRHHGMHSLSELVLIPSITYYERRYLPLFLYAGEEGIPWWRASVDSMKLAIDSLSLSAQGKRSLGNLVRKVAGKPRHELASRMDIPLYHRRGYLVQDGYRGSRIYNKVYYRLESSGHLSASLRMERDAGERGIDSYGGHVLLNDMVLAGEGHGHGVSLKSFLLGDYKVSFGQGLVLNQGFGMGKLSFNFRKSGGFRPHRSTEEMNFMRGAGLTLSISNLDISLFYSHRHWDATPDKSSGQGPLTVKTIVRDGYHRTDTERGKKGLLAADVMGGNLTWRKAGFHLGGTGYWMKTDKELVPGTAFYRQIYPQGNHFGAMGLDYGYEAYRWRFFGEAAYGGTLLRLSADAELQTGQEDLRNGCALLNGVSWRVSQRYSLTAVQRYYNHHYYSFFSSVMSELGRVQNETGGMVRLDAQPWDGVGIVAYVDMFHNPWPRYGLTRSSHGWEALAEGTCTVTRSHTLKVRYQAIRKDYEKETGLRHRLRFQWLAYTPSERWRFTTTAMIHALPGSHGEAIGTYARYTGNPDYQDRTARKGTLSASVGGIYFHTTDFDSRIYQYEPTVTEMMYVPSYSGHGIRGTGVVRWCLYGDLLQFELKYGVTRYFDREVQGSGLQTIYSPVKNDVTMQARIRL